MALTKTNTDALCLLTVGNPIIVHLRKLKYRYYLWTGLYMLETHEKIAFHFVVWPAAAAFCLCSWSFLAAFCYYIVVFGRAVVEGWR